MTATAACESDANRVLLLRNAQRDCPVNLRFLRQTLRRLLEVELRLEGYDLALHLITAKAMARANLTHLGHEGPTDVITFNYADTPARLHGELLVCPAVARIQARDHGTSWMSEVIRYALHGVLHLRGYDDQTVLARRRMKREEDRLLDALEHGHDFRRMRRTARTTCPSKLPLSARPSGLRLPP
ncbi:MAG: rRNA maturation RNase YbeY [Synechococcaceae cyanobacterium]|nr:rRNA maturation RNase YbeY [Synechococcaceae cyanobacterium]